MPREGYALLTTEYLYLLSRLPSDQDGADPKNNSNRGGDKLVMVRAVTAVARAKKIPPRGIELRSPR
jgi:hypothetical protein